MSKDVCNLTEGEDFHSVRREPHYKSFAGGVG